MSTKRDPMTEALARVLHKRWCDLGTCSWGADDYSEAASLLRDVWAEMCPLTHPAPDATTREVRASDQRTTEGA